MRVKIIGLYVGACLLLSGICQAGLIEDFVQEHLALDLQKYPLGSLLSDHPELVKREVAKDEPYYELTQTNSPALFYQFNFREGRLTQITIGHRGKECCDKLLGSFLQMTQLPPKIYPLVFEDNQTTIRYEAMCTPAENSAALVTIQSRQEAQDFKPPYPIDEATAIAIARRAVLINDSWDQKDVSYNTTYGPAYGWSVSVRSRSIWQATHKDSEYLRRITIDQSGRVTRYRKGGC